MTKRRRSPVKTEVAEPQICTIDLRLEILRQLPYFTDLSDGAVNNISARFTEKGYQPDEMIYLAGEEATRLYVVASGKVKLLRYTLDGQEVLLDILVPGEHFGSLSALGDPVYPDTAQAQTGVCVLSIDAEDFRQLLETYPAITLRTLDIISQRLRDSQEMVRQLSVSSVEQRLAFTLLKLAEKLGEVHDEGLLIQMPLSREDLAAMTGTTTETVSRTLRRFQQQGLVNTGRQWIAIADRERLQATANIELD